MTMLEDLTKHDRKIPTTTWMKPYMVDRPNSLQFHSFPPVQPLPYAPAFWECGLSPDFWMDEAPAFHADFTDAIIKREPSPDSDNHNSPVFLRQAVSNTCPQIPDCHRGNPLLPNCFGNVNAVLNPNGNHLVDHHHHHHHHNNSNNNSIRVHNNNNNNTTDDATPTENAISLTDVDQLLNPELTFYDELQMSGLVKREIPARACSADERMDYDSDSAESDASVAACSGTFQDVESEIVRQVKNDIQEARSTLELPSDLKRWSPQNVQNWILWTLKRYNLGMVKNLDNFLMDGREFLALTEQDFKARSPLLGAALYAQLDMWQNVGTLDDPTPTSSPAKTRLAEPSPTFVRVRQEERENYLHHSATGQENLRSVPSSTEPVSPADPVSPTSSSLVNTSFSSSRSSCGSDDESETGGRQTIHLWQFLKMLLLQPQFYGNCIRWLDRENGIFKIEDSQRVARLWGKRKNRPAMNYDKLSRSIRQYYKKGIIKKTENSKRLVYRFCHPYSL